MTGKPWPKKIKEIEQKKEYQPKKSHPRILDPYHGQILQWLEKDFTGVRIYEKIQQKGVKVGYSTSTVKDYLTLIRKKDKVFYVFTPYRQRRHRWISAM